MDNADLYGRFLTLNYALPEKIKGGLQGCAAQPIWADADSWFEHQQQEEEMQLLKVENQAAMQGGARARKEEESEKRRSHGNGRSRSRGSETKQLVLRY